MTLPLKIISMGKALSKRKVTSAELNIQLNKKLSFVEKKSGIALHYDVDEQGTTIFLAVSTLKEAMNNTTLSPDSINLLICSFTVPQQILPCTISFILAQAGFSDSKQRVNASCVGLIAVLHLVANLLAHHTYRCMTLVFAECTSLGLNLDILESSLIFGDSTAAAIVDRDEGAACESCLMEIYPKGKLFCKVLGGSTLRNQATGMENNDFKFSLDGKHAFRLTPEKIEDFLTHLCAPLSITRDNIDVVIPHQASHLGLLHVTERLKSRKELIINIYSTHGNLVFASIPTTLYEAMITGKLTADKKVLLLGTVARLTLARMILTV